MSVEPVSDRMITCPHCSYMNTLVGSALPMRMTVFCSHCGEKIGIYSDLRPSGTAGVARAMRSAPMLANDGRRAVSGGGSDQSKQTLL